MVLFCALGLVLCDWLLLYLGSCSSIDAVVCAQKSSAMKHGPPMSHFQDPFYLPHINKYTESKFCFSAPKTYLFLPVNLHFYS